MKLGFITAIREDIAIPSESMTKRVAANLGPLYMAAYLAKVGIEVEVIIKDRLEDLAPHAPEILGISSVTENIEYAKELALRAKALWNPILVLGGAHLTALPKTLPAVFDVGVIGEGEVTMATLLQTFLREGKLSEAALRGIPGLVFRGQEGFVQTEVHKGVNKLDDLPPPDRRKYIKNTGITYMMTSRGCPYTCSFCTIPTISEGYRKHSPEYVVEEIKSIRATFPHVKHIRIFDDLFVVDRKRVIEIAERVHAEGLDQELNFGCWVRANLLDDKILKAFRKMNMLYAAFGAESGSSRVLGKLKPGCSIEDNQSAVDRLVDHGLIPGFSVILGHPLEEEEDLLATYDFIEGNLEKVYEVEMNVAIPWPGTELWEYAKERGIVSESMDFRILKECAHLPNYSTEDYPYLNPHIPPARFDLILDRFKKIYWAMAKKNVKTMTYNVVNPRGEIANYF